MNVIESNASVGKRILNNLIDIPCYFCFAILIGIVQSLIGVEIMSNMNGFTEKLFGVVLVLIYYILFEGATGKSPAKFITRTRILDGNGNKPGFMSIVTRSLVRFIPFEGLVALGSEGRTLHDKLSETYVVDENLFAMLKDEE